MSRKKNNHKNKLSTQTAADYANAIKNLPKAKTRILFSTNETGENFRKDQKNESKSTSEDILDIQNETTKEFRREITELKLSTIKSDIERSCSELISKHKIEITTQISDNKSTILMWAIGTVVVLALSFLGILFVVMPMIFDPKFKDISNEINSLNNRISPLEFFVEDQKANRVSEEFSINNEPK